MLNLGAGKSTLSLAFFRIIPISHGSITIDGIDISKIGLYDLRSKLTIIPQDPILFSGDLRSNLDPLNENDDLKIWEALKRVHFLDSLQYATQAEQKSETPTKEQISLNYKVQENGNNFSQGQRQLLCLARALLQGNKVILLDEATASVDNDTDAKIQETIRSEFGDRTIMCIAHRLKTVIDYDKVLVLEKGSVAEYGTPIDLIENRSGKGVFKTMCQETGEYEELVKLAQKKHLSV
jgi:ABC-type multidrug transport system fused ATPase/permease subunit